MATVTFNLAELKKPRDITSTTNLDSGNNAAKWLYIDNADGDQPEKLALSTLEARYQTADPLLADIAALSPGAGQDGYSLVWDNTSGDIVLQEAGGAVDSVFGRTGVVAAQSGDYTAAQVTNAAATNAANTFTNANTFNSSLSVGTTNGIDINPGSDIDADLITVGVTGSPKLYWDESENRMAIEGQFAVLSDTVGDEYALTITNSGSSGEFFTTRNRLGNRVFKLHQDGDGEAFFYVSDRNGNDWVTFRGDVETVIFGDDDTALGKLHLKQPSSSGGIAPLYLEQLDDDFAILAIEAESDSLSADESLVDAGDFTTPGSIAAWAKVTVNDRRVAGITDGNYWMPLYNIPTA